MPLILDVLTHIDERSAAAGARQLEHQFESSGEAAGIGFGTNLAKGVTSGFAAGDFDSMLGALSSGGLAAKAASHGSVIGAAFAGGITVAAAAGIVDLGVKVGETFEGINRDITLHTAASGKALEELKGHADALVGSLDSSSAHIGADMATIATRLQMTAGPALDQLTQNVEMLRDRMGNFNAGALAGALQNMGVTGATANDTLAALAQTVQRTDIPLSELATTLAANTELFKDMHLTAGQAGNVIGELSAKGIPATTALMGLQMAMKKTPEGEDFATYIKSVADALDYFGSQGPKGEAAAEQISVALGGPRKWTDLSAAAHAYLDTANQGAAAFAGHSQDLTDLGNQTRTLGNYWDEVKNKIAAALAPPGLSVTDEISQKMESLIGFIDAHSTDLRNLFEGAISVIEQVVEGLGQVATFLGQHPGLIEAVEVAFGTWEAIKGVNFVLTGIESIVAWLGIEATTAVATGATVETAAASAGAAIAAAAETGETGMLALAATLGTVTADIITLGAALGSVLFTAGDAPGATKDNANDKQKAGQRYQQAHGGQMPPGYQQWLQGEGPMPAGMGPYMQAPGAPAGAPGQPPAGQGTGRFAPGQGPDVGGRAGPGLPGSSVAPGGGDTGTGGDASSANALLQSLEPKGPKGPRLPTAPEVPYGAGYGAAPRPGESAEQYSAEQKVLEERHNVEEARARLNQLEHDNNATQDDIQKAKNALLHAQQEEYSAELSQVKKHTGDMEQLGAKIDNDFGISKGLPGIAENLTKFLANLAFAPALGAMSGMQAGLGFPGGQGLGGAKGLLGMAGLSGAFGQQFTVGGGGGAGRGGGGGFGTAGYTSPSLPSIGSPQDLAGASAGVANLFHVAEALQGTPYSMALRNDCSGMVSKLANAALGLPPTASFSTANEGQWLSSHGFQSGTGGPGDLNIGWHQGGPGGGHTAATLPGGVNAESGGSNSSFTLGPTAAGASNPQFDQHMYLPMGAQQPAAPQPAGAGGSNLTNPGLTGGPLNTSSLPGYHNTPGLARGGAVGYYAEGGTLGGTPATGATGAAAGAATGAAAGVPAGTDTVPAMLSPGEHVLTTQDVSAMGGQQGVYNFRAALQGGSAPAGARPSTAGGSGATQIGGIGAPQGLGSGFTVTGGGLIGVAESIPATIANMAIQAGMSAAAAAATGGAVEDLNYYYFDDGGDVGGAGGGSAAGVGGPGGGGVGGSPGGGGAAAVGASDTPGGGAGTGAGGGGAPGGSVVSAAIGIGIQEINEAISKVGQGAGALVGGAQQTFGLQQFAQTPLAQKGWLNRIIGGIAGAQPQLPNMAGKGSGNASPEGVPGMTPPQEVSPFGPDRGDAPGPAGAIGSAPVASAPAPPPHTPALPSPRSALGDAGVGPNMSAFQGPTPDSVAGVGSAGGFRGFAQGGDVGGGSGSSGSMGPAVHIENYNEADPNSAGQDIARHVEASYAAQSMPGSR